jgi:hypothetical protein
MKRIAVVCVAGLALVLALGSGVYAASKISGKTIKQSSLPGDRVKANSLGGKQINEAKLGIVPQAEAVSTSFNSGLVSASVGETKVLLNLGSSFVVEGVCAADTADVFIRSLADGASMYSDFEDYDNADFAAGVAAQIGYGADNSNDHVGFYADDYDGWIAVAANGAEIYSGEAHSAKDLLGAPCSFLVAGDQLN